MSFNELAITRAMRLIARAMAAGRLEIEACGLDNVPRQGPLILVARHYHHLFDGIALFLTVPRRTHLIVTLDWAPNRFTRAVMEALTRLARWPVVSRPPALVNNPDRARRQAISTQGGVHRHQRRALRAAVRLLIERRALVIFPEGYPNIDPHYTPKTDREELLPFKRGFAALAAAAERRSKAEILIVPVGLHYSGGDRWKVRLAFGAPVSLKNFSSRQCLMEHVETQVRLLSKIED